MVERQRKTIMVEPIIVIPISLFLAVIMAGIGLTIDIPYIQYGLPMTVLLIGSGIYTLQTKGVTGIAEEYASSVFVGSVSMFLTYLIVQDKN